MTDSVGTTRLKRSNAAADDGRVTLPLCCFAFLKKESEFGVLLRLTDSGTTNTLLHSF